MQGLEKKTRQFVFSIDQIKVNCFFRSFQFTSYPLSVAKVYLWNHIPANMSEQINKAIKFYQQTSHRNGIYCQQLELHDSSWDMFIQRLVIGTNHVNN